MPTTEVENVPRGRLVGSLYAPVEAQAGSPAARAESPVQYHAIGLPLDGSSVSEHALPFARWLARRIEARLCLVHVHRPGVDRAYTGRAEYAWRENELRCEESRYLWSKLQGEEREPSAASVVLAGRVPDALLRFIREQSVDLLVMTRHGAGGGLGRPWLGSVVDRLLRSVRVPVLLVPESGQVPELGKAVTFRRVLVPLDGSGPAEEVLDHALTLGQACGATYVLAQVEPPSSRAPDADEPAEPSVGRAAQRYLHYVAERLRERGVDVEVRVVTDAAPADAILTLANVERVDLIALTLHGEGGKQRRMLGSVADKIIRAAETAVLAHRPRGARALPPGR